MEEKKLDELVAIKKKSDASEKKKIEFCLAMKNLISEEGISKKVEKYLSEGFSFSGVLPVFSSIADKTPDEQNTLLYNLVTSETVKNNKQGIGFKIVTHTLALSVNNDLVRPVLRDKTLSLFVETAKNKKGEMFAFASTVFAAYFVNQINVDNFTEKSSIDDSKFKDVFFGICKQLLADDKGMTKANAESLKRIKEWITGNSIESAKSGDVSKDAPTQKAKSSNDYSNEKIASYTNNDYDGVIQDLKTFTDRLSLTFNEVRRNRRTIGNLNLEIENNNQIIKQIEAQLLQRTNELNALRTENTDLLSKVTELRAEKESLNLKIGINHSKIEELTNEIDKQESVLNVYSTASDNRLKETCNAIAAKLRIEYEDFAEIEESEMTAAIGDILREQLKNIFDILREYDIHPEGKNE